jgi:hypothetical protein
MDGHCLCGAVRLASPEARAIGACHCGFCRRWGGGPLLAVHCGSDVQWQGVEHIEVFSSSEWAERAFCRKCGTHLYYKLLVTGEYFVPAGVFDSNDFELASQIYIDNKPGYYSFAEQTPMLTEQQVLEQFSAAGAAADREP